MRKGFYAPRIGACTVCAGDYIYRSPRSRCCSDECRVIASRTSWRNYGRRNRAARQVYQRKLYDRQAPKVAARVAAYRATEAGQRVRRSENQKRPDPVKQRARRAVALALKSGALARGPCEGCRAEETQAHHDDYDKPLVVRWLCTACHGLEHRKPRELPTDQTQGST